jgi:NAD(P)-dependent dehydrogenase (short-subunit alcohol dehydrogenase family)
MGRLAGKYTLITGGTSGIGLATAQEFIAEGAQVAVTGRNPETLAEAQRILGDSAWVIPADAGDITAKSAGGDARVPLATAGRGVYQRRRCHHGLLEEWQEEAWDRLMRINLKGPFFLIQALLPLLNNPSSVILCGSVSARIGLPTSSVYAASKAGLLLARTLSAELLPRGVRVNGLSPGPVETPALHKLGLSEEAQKALQGDIANLVPLGAWARRRSWQKPRCIWHRMSRAIPSARNCWSTAEREVCNSEGADAGHGTDIQRRPHGGRKQADGVNLHGA